MYEQEQQKISMKIKSHIYIEKYPTIKPVLI